MTYHYDGRILKNPFCRVSYNTSSSVADERGLNGKYILLDGSIYFAEEEKGEEIAHAEEPPAAAEEEGKKSLCLNTDEMPRCGRAKLYSFTASSEHIQHACATPNREFHLFPSHSMH